MYLKFTDLFYDLLRFYIWLGFTYKKLMDSFIFMRNFNFVR